MDLYVASSWHNRPEVRAAYAKLRAAGHSITHDWTIEEAVPGFDATPQVSNEYGIRDYIGVLNADAVVVLAHEKAKDTRFEMGLAVGLQKPVLVVHNERWHSVFMDERLGVYVAKDMDEVIESLRKWESEWFGLSDFTKTITPDLEFKS